MTCHRPTSTEISEAMRMRRMEDAYNKVMDYLVYQGMNEIDLLTMSTSAFEAIVEEVCND